MKSNERLLFKDVKPLFKDVRPELRAYLVNPKDESRSGNKDNGTKIEIRCPVCGEVNKKRIGTFVNSSLGTHNCNACRSIRVKHQDCIQYLVNQEDGSLPYSSRKKILVKCPHCNKEKEMRASSLVRDGFSCGNCRSIRVKRPDLMQYLTKSEDGNLRCGSHKKILVKCPHCNQEKEIPVNTLTSDGIGCLHCRSIKVKRPDLIQHLVNIEDSNLPCGSGKKIEVKCPHCGEQKLVRVFHLTKQGVGCRTCTDQVSTSEKFMINILQQIGLNFEREYSPNWSNGKRYDFYLKDLNLIIETHGEQHYRKNGWGVPLEEIQQNDKYKRELALSHGIKHYIEIDCRKSTLNFLQPSVQNALEGILPIHTVDFSKAWEFTQERYQTTLNNEFTGAN